MPHPPDFSQLISRQVRIILAAECGCSVSRHDPSRGMANTCSSPQSTRRRSCFENVVAIAASCFECFASDFLSLAHRPKRLDVTTSSSASMESKPSCGHEDRLRSVWE